MQENNYNRLITPWGYIGYGLLFAIPLVGLICAIVFAFSHEYPCRRNYARAVLIGYVFALIAALIMFSVYGFNLDRMLKAYGYYYRW